MAQYSSLKVLQDAAPRRLSLARLSTNTTTSSHPVHRWFNFVAGFSPELVQASVALEGGRRNARRFLLDPFSGCGTAPLAARLIGLSAVAYEAHPFFAIISEAKANSHRYWADLKCIQSVIARGLSRGGSGGVDLSPSASAFLGKMFNQDHLDALYSARRELSQSGLAAHPLAILILSRVLDHCCFAATDGIYKAPTSRKRALPPVSALDRVMATLRNDESAATFHRAPVHIYEKSSEKMDEVSDASIDVVVTSPPYINNFDFAEMTRMYLYFWGMASSWSEITSRVRSRLIVNTTTALETKHRELQQEYRKTLPDDVRQEADAIVMALGERRKIRAGKKDYHLLVYPYFSQMQQVIRETRRVLKPGACMHMMVSDAALYGIHIPAPQWLARMIGGCGFHEVQCEMVRARGKRWVLEKREGSAKGLGEYYIFGRAV